MNQYLIAQEFYVIWILKAGQFRLSMEMNGINLKLCELLTKLLVVSLDMERITVQ